jgi:hypothetical protein
MDLDGVPIYFYLELAPIDGQSQRLVLAMPNGRLHAVDTLPLDISFPGTDSGSEPYSSINGFRQFWDSAHQPRVWFLTEVPRFAEFILDEESVVSVALERGETRGSTLDLRNGSLGGCRDDVAAGALRRAREGRYDVVFCRTIHEGMVVIPARARQPRLPADLQQWLIKEFELDGPAGRFAESFPELDGVTREYQQLSLESAARILDDELKRTGERIEFLGVSLPEPVMATWGGIVILMLQLYFWLHLRYWKRQGGMLNHEPNHVPWIAIYPDVFARAATYATIGLFPTTATLLAALLTDVSASRAGLLWLIVAGVLFLSLLVCRTLHEHVPVPLGSFRGGNG